MVKIQRQYASEAQLNRRYYLGKKPVYSNVAHLSAYIFQLRKKKKEKKHKSNLKQRYTTKDACRDSVPFCVGSKVSPNRNSQKLAV